MICQDDGSPPMESDEKQIIKFQKTMLCEGTLISTHLLVFFTTVIPSVLDWNTFIGYYIGNHRRHDPCKSFSKWKCNVLDIKNNL
jgi:hypothetical protein